MFSSAEFWGAVGLIAIVAAVTVRWAIAKATGKEIKSGDLDILTNLRAGVVTAMSTGYDLIQLEKERGRSAVRARIAEQIRTFISETDALTDAEKTLIENISIDYLVELVEKQLVSLGVMKAA